MFVLHYDIYDLWYQLSRCQVMTEISQQKQEDKYNFSPF